MDLDGKSLKDLRPGLFTPKPAPEISFVPIEGAGVRVYPVAGNSALKEVIIPGNGRMGVAPDTQGNFTATRAALIRAGFVDAEGRPCRV